MLTTVEAEIDVDGKVVLLEPLPVTRKSKVLVTLLEENGRKSETKGKENVEQMSKFLHSPEFINRKSYSEEEIEAQIEEARNSWE